MVFIWKTRNKKVQRIVHTQKVAVLSDLSLVVYENTRPSLVFITQPEVDLIIQHTGELEAIAIAKIEAANDYTPLKRKPYMNLPDYWTALGLLLGLRGKMVLTGDKPPVTAGDAIMEAIKAPWRAPLVKGGYRKKRENVL